ncbi:LysR family transcriptional regulator [Pseudomonas aeruginosa]|uniref:LysR family transcriptional regulator n=1 Tax=Pseudomonas aeruginosa TaxID=287 RepID=UPI003D2E58C0
MSANLDIELLRTFHAILRFGRFLAAASHLNRSPSAVSTHVRRLEELAGGRLFERDNQSVRLTPLGQRFQRQTAELLETHDRVLAGLRRREEPLRVRFGISEEYAGKLLGRLLPRLGAELPALELEVLTDASGRLAGRLRRGQLDLACWCKRKTKPRTTGTPARSAAPSRCGSPATACGSICNARCRWPCTARVVPIGRALLEALGATGRRWRTVVSSPGAAALEAAIEGGLAIGVIDRARVGPTMRVLGPAEGFAELPAHRIRLAFAPGERPPALERLGELIAEEFRL